MTTYLLLALTDDGAKLRKLCDICDVMPRIEPSCPPVRTSTDRGQYSTFEVAGYSIDVVRLPEVKEPNNGQ